MLCHFYYMHFKIGGGWQISGRNQWQISGRNAAGKLSNYVRQQLTEQVVAIHIKQINRQLKFNLESLNPYLIWPSI